MRKLLISTFTLICFIFLNNVNAQQSNQDLKYRRSSLNMILIESESFPNKDLVMKSWKDYPFPDKYNKHETDVKSVDINSINLSEKDLMNAGYLIDTITNPLKLAKAIASLKILKYLNSDSTVAVVLPSERKKFEIKINKFIKQKKLANKLVASWFDLSKDGKFDMKLVQERGSYNASELEANIAKGQAMGLASLADAGEELIKNTFVTFTKLDFVPNEPAARVVRDLALEQANAMSVEMLRKKAVKAAEKMYNKTKEGYSLWSKTWLYRLHWNDSIADEFYTTLWSNPKEFEKTNLFSLDFIGVQYNQSLVTFSLKETRTEAQIIDLTLVRNLDNAFAKLQKKNDVFKPKVPVISVNPIIAQIGMKENLEGGEKFEVLEMKMNRKTGLTEYKKVGTATVDKKIIWDNRYNAGEKIDQGDVTGTLFHGSKRIQPGMLLKLIK